MRNILFLLLTGLLICHACQPKKGKYEPDQYLSKTQQDQLKESVIRYIAKKPKKATHETKFDSTYDQYYAEMIAKHHLIGYYRSQDGNEFMLTKRIAPSLQEKYVATGIKMTRDNEGNILSYEEKFRTWKLPNDLLMERGLFLFELMVKGEDLSPYYADKAGFNYIEFPDSKAYFDIVLRRWLVKDSSEEFETEETEQPPSAE